MIDLTRFCWTDAWRGGKYDMTQPATFGGFTYATDAKILIRVPTPGEPDSPPQEKPFPPADKMLLWVGQPCDLEWNRLPANPQFYGESVQYHDCPTCGNEDAIMEPVTGIYLDLFGSRGTAQIARKYADLLATLPGLEYQITGPEEPIRLRFDGGHGALMPLAQTLRTWQELRASSDDSQDSPG